MTRDERQIILLVRAATFAERHTVLKDNASWGRRGRRCCAFAILPLPPPAAGRGARQCKVLGAHTGHALLTAEAKANAKAKAK